MSEDKKTAEKVKPEQSGAQLEHIKQQGKLSDDEVENVVGGRIPYYRRSE
ncbi:hypothetical protein ACS3UN_12880 [Oscillospiraceae bacterium LTW-04]|nr:hypothetical protein RBH76_00690 [Oscillospiraceae bacterium MB24-C1]